MAEHHVLPLLKQNTKEQTFKNKTQKSKIQKQKRKHSDFSFENGIVFVQEVGVRARAVF
jgi:hypothetical protein